LEDELGCQCGAEQGNDGQTDQPEDEAEHLPTLRG
jgi:hypothetical protein